MIVSSMRWSVWPVLSRHDRDHSLLWSKCRQGSTWEPCSCHCTWSPSRLPVDPCSTHSVHVQLDELQPVARAAAKVIVSGPGLRAPELVFAHSLKPSIQRPWDNLDATLEAPQGTMLWSQAEPCMPALQQVESPRITGDLGNRLGCSFRFNEPGERRAGPGIIELLASLCTVH
jgi:hypothetical protein